MSHRVLVWCVAALSLGLPSVAFAQRELHWESLAVTAHLDAAGTLHVSETQAMVFTGDWNGGERRFNIHPRQKLSLLGIYRNDSGDWQELREDSDIDDVDEYAWADRTTLRWRSRQPSDAPFDGRTIRYDLRYELSGILLKNGEQYTLDHDFAFRDRVGAINRFTLRLTLDPAWQPLTELRSEYTAGPLPPGETFVLTMPLRYTGAGEPATLDLSRPLEIAVGVWSVLIFTGVAVLWFFVREQAYGRFAPLAADVGESWLREQVLKHPAEVVGAAWDEGIGSPEVVALIARMVSEGKLESDVGSGNKKNASMTLRLKVDRSKLEGYERTLVDGLFFNGRTETNTAAVKAHYRSKGFNPAEQIQGELDAAVRQAFPPSDVPRRIKGVSTVLFFLGLGVMIVAWFAGHPLGVSTVVLTLTMLVVAGIAAFLGTQFRASLGWGLGAALLCLIPAVIIACGAAAFLWFRAGTGQITLHPLIVFGFVLVALALANAAINALKSRQRHEGMAFRKRLAAGRAFFVSELRKERPALRDEWYPWLLAFGLTKEMDDWSAQQASPRSRGGRGSGTTISSASSSGSTTSSEGWTGFGGGRSGGAGGGASWQAAATGMAAGVSPPSSSGSGGSSGGGGGGSSSSGSSGGGGGGGW